jgi:glycerophosphoryl diester phosphodiesterase
MDIVTEQLALTFSLSTDTRHSRPSSGSRRADTLAGVTSDSPLQVVIAGRRRVICCHRASLFPGLPPNSVAAVSACVAAGVPRLEIDVRFLADDAMLIFHDDDLAHETTGTGRVGALDTASARALRYRADERHALCFLDDVVDAMRGGETLLQVDLKLMRPISPERVEQLAEALAPLGGRVLIGSQAQWNLHAFAERGFRVAFDPTLQWHHAPNRSPGLTPSRLGVHGLWDDAPLAHIRHATPRQYVDGRLRDLAGLLPGAVEWMVDIATLRHLASLGCLLGEELAAHGRELAAWTVRDHGEESTTKVLEEMFALGATTVIADDPDVVAGYAARLASVNGV